MSIRQDQRFENLHGDTRAIVDTLLETRISQEEDLHRHFKTFTESQERQQAQRRSRFVYIDGEKRRVRIELDLLESLRFPMMDERYDRLAKAHEMTFTWIFEDPQACHKPWDNFVTWIANGAGIYWIQGKAASGKSTLMRFIWDNPETLSNLDTWSANSQIVLARFFFWNSGISEQRSQTGLLRSLLSEVLNRHRGLIPTVFPEEWENKSALAAHDMPISPEAWSLVRLQKAFSQLISGANARLKFCFFIDGLDEYEGDPADIAQYFYGLSQCSMHAKFCVSSRPWPAFQEIYRETPGLRLQDLTYDDIKIYVSDHLVRNNHMQQLSREEPEASSRLIEEVVQKAGGVFLWVTLVVRSLLNGLRNGDGMFHLLRRLAILPSDLEKLYEHMLKSIDPLYMEEAS